MLEYFYQVPLILKRLCSGASSPYIERFCGEAQGRRLLPMDGNPAHTLGRSFRSFPTAASGVGRVRR